MHQRDDKPVSLAAMPGILVIVTLGYLFVVHAGHLVRGHGEVEWTARGLERFYRETSASAAGEPVNRLRARLGLSANDVVQRDGELYYLPDIAHLTRRSFLDAPSKSSHVVLSPESRDTRNSAPLPAILEFDRDLRSRGIRLVLMPIPSKAMFAGPRGKVMRNSGYEEFVDDLQSRGVLVFDPAAHFAKCAARGERLYLATDSHWTPEAMRTSAGLLAAYLKGEGLVASDVAEQFHGSSERVTNSGDLARLLGVGMSERWQETIVVHTLAVGREAPWRPQTDSAVLLLGDSFTNVFSLESMGWGRGAGFAEAMSLALGFSVDSIARNADGAFASRQELQRQAGRLDGKRVVIWQFAARELSFGDWKVLPVPSQGAGDREEVPRGEIALRGTVAQVAPVPELSRAPYRQAVMELLLTEVTSPDHEVPGEVVLLGLGVDDRVPTAMTKWQVGREVSVTVRQWREVEAQFGRLHRFALDDPELRLLETARFWVE